MKWSDNMQNKPKNKQMLNKKKSRNRSTHWYERRTCNQVKPGDYRLLLSPITAACCCCSSHENIQQTNRAEDRVSQSPCVCVRVCVCSEGKWNGWSHCGICSCLINNDHLDRETLRSQRNSFVTQSESLFPRRKTHSAVHLRVNSTWRWENLGQGQLPWTPGHQTDPGCKSHHKNHMYPHIKEIYIGFKHRVCVIKGW